MSSIWLKIACGVVAIVVIIVVVGRFTSSDKPSPAPCSKLNPRSRPSPRQSTTAFERDKQFNKEPPKPAEQPPAQPQEPAPQPQRHSNRLSLRHNRPDDPPALSFRATSKVRPRCTSCR